MIRHDIPTEPQRAEIISLRRYAALILVIGIVSILGALVLHWAGL